MTHAEQILRAVAGIIQNEKTHFTRLAIREAIGVDANEWEKNYSPIFQAMRIGQPVAALRVATKWRNVFRQASRGQYQLTSYGINLTHTLVEPK